MNFSFFTRNNTSTNFDIKVGQKWSDYINKQNSPMINSILTAIDNGNGIVDEAELDILNKFIKTLDKNEDKKINKKEFDNTVHTNNANVITGASLAWVLKDDINAKARFGMPTTGKNFIKHINLINTKNVEAVLNNYNDNGETLLDGILGEVGLPVKTRYMALTRIINVLCANYQKQGVKTDDISAAFKAELKKQADKVCRMDATRLNNLVTKLQNRKKDTISRNKQNLELHNRVKKYVVVKDGELRIFPTTEDIKSYANSYNKYLLWEVYNDTKYSKKTRLNIIKKSIKWIAIDAKANKVDSEKEQNEINKLLEAKDIDIEKISKLSYKIINKISRNKEFPETGTQASEILNNNYDENYFLTLRYEKKNKGHNFYEDLISNEGISKSNRVKYLNKLVSGLQKFNNVNSVNNYDLYYGFKVAINEFLNAKNKKEESIAQEKLLDIIECTNNRFPDEASEVAEKVNGKIDKDFSQGNTGDCWLLAAIKSISLKEKGQKVLTNSIKVDKNGNVTVTLKGGHKSYKFTQKEIAARTDLSQGDMDVRAIEMAVDQYIKDMGYGDLTNYKFSINGNHETFAYKLLLGTFDTYALEEKRKQENMMNINQFYSGEVNKIKFDNKKIDSFNDKNKIFCVSTHTMKKDVKLSSDSDSSAILTCNHAYSVVKSDKKFVYLINPWDSSKTFKITREQFIKFFDNCHETML